MSDVADVVVIGAGIVGLATARSVLLSRPGTCVVVLEAEPTIAAHQSGHNSNVIHSGLYYRPGSLKAEFARAGGLRMIEYCREQGVPVRKTGKVIVATRSSQLERMNELLGRGAANGVNVRSLPRAELAELEPEVSGVDALFVEGTAITDFGLVCGAMAAEVETLGGTVQVSRPVVEVATCEGEVRVTTEDRELRCAVMVNCAGLRSDLVARMSGCQPNIRIVPFRGEYSELSSTPRPLVSIPVYPVPDPALPFLGTHLTPGLDGTVHVGPNALLALSRHGYRWRDVDPRHVTGLVRDPAVWRMVRRFWRHGAGEIARSLVKPLFVRSIREMVPVIKSTDLVRCSSGVRAQAVHRDGTLVDDFVIARHARTIHVLNAPSPAATASLLIGERIAAAALDEFDARPSIRA
ncbi:L-2-hydroxyglutarate oxidase [Nocardioides terrisoli]|uniref:L-2-hydroxyglutarate oxidase n=1 Tax=Nocardioides terrisoli TaxID=3388267 RepID=UPI00287BA762|nr:L-2-hydroxyglutarate oxidase [Nocardioides marmorisolisilvae]